LHAKPVAKDDPQNEVAGARRLSLRQRRKRRAGSHRPKPERTRWKDFVNQEKTRLKRYFPRSLFCEQE
jgi:hypothetical protein